MLYYMVATILCGPSFECTILNIHVTTLSTVCTPHKPYTPHIPHGLQLPAELSCNYLWPIAGFVNECMRFAWQILCQTMNIPVQIQTQSSKFICLFGQESLRVHETISRLYVAWNNPDSSYNINNSTDIIKKLTYKTDIDIILYRTHVVNQVPCTVQQTVCMLIHSVQPLHGHSISV